MYLKRLFQEGRGAGTIAVREFYDHNVCKEHKGQVKGVFLLQRRVSKARKMRTGDETAARKEDERDWIGQRTLNLRPAHSHRGLHAGLKVGQSSKT